MKIFRYIKNLSVASLAVAAVAMVSSCEDMLDKKPTGQFTADQIDESAIEGLMAAAYAGLEAHYFGNNEAFAGPSTNWIFDVRSDDAYKGGGGVSLLHTGEPSRRKGQLALLGLPGDAVA